MQVIVSNKELIKIVFPPVIAICLFMATVFGYLLPVYKDTLIDQQKNMLRQMVGTAWNMVKVVEKGIQQNDITLDEAKKIAKEHLRGMRYGEDGMDYFWINDMDANLVMHPYRPDLEGVDVSNFLDPNGKALFKEFVEIAKKNGDGYSQYEWQWKNDASRIEPKLSYVRHFPSWNWVIGTGVYLKDINSEIKTLSNKMMLSSGVIAFIVTLLTIYIIIRTIDIERRRLEAVASLQKHQEHLEALVDERTIELSKEINERIKVGEALKRVSITDDLTGLYNRRGFLTLCEKQLQLSKRHNNPLCLLYMDLDNMKYINDTFSHNMGDKALIETAEILNEVFRDSDIISRLGGDEFAVLVNGKTEKDGSESFMRRFQEKLTRVNSQQNRPYELLISIGRACYDSTIHKSIDELLSESDARMYEQKIKRKQSRKS